MFVQQLSCYSDDSNNQHRRRRGDLFIVFADMHYAPLCSSTIQYQYRTWYFWPMRVSTQMASPVLTMLTRTQTTDMRMACISLG